MEGGIIKGQMAAQETGGPDVGRGSRQEGTPASQAARQGAGRGRSSWTAPPWRPVLPETQGALPRPQTGRSTGWAARQHERVDWPQEALCPTSVGLALPATPQGGRIWQGVRGEWRQEDGGGLVFASPLPGTREGPCLPLSWLRGRCLCFGIWSAMGAESPEQLNHSTQALKGRGRWGGRAVWALSGLQARCGRALLHEPPSPGCPQPPMLRAGHPRVYQEVAEERCSPDCCWLSSLEPQVSPPDPASVGAALWAGLLPRVGTGGVQLCLPQPQPVLGPPGSAGPPLPH